VVKKQPSDLGFFFPSVGCPLLGVGVCQGKWGPWLPRPPFQLQQQETQGKAESPTDDKETGGFHQDKSKATAETQSRYENCYTASWGLLFLGVTLMVGKPSGHTALSLVCSRERATSSRPVRRSGWIPGGRLGSLRSCPLPASPWEGQAAERLGSRV